VTWAAPAVPDRCRRKPAGDGGGVGQAVGGLAHDLERPVRGVAGVDPGHHGNAGRAERGELVDECHVDADQVFRDQLTQDLGAQERRVFQGGRGEALVHDHHAAAAGLLQDLAHADQFVLEPSPEVLQIFFDIKMTEDLIREEQLSDASGHGKTQAGQVEQLPGHAGEGRLAALVRAGDDDRAFRAVQVEAVAHHRPPPDQLAGQGQVEPVRHADTVTLRADLG
jgi:hypothetical protein